MSAHSKVPLKNWAIYADYLPDVLTYVEGRWRLKVQPNEHGTYQWEAENWNNGSNAIHHVIGEAPTKQLAADRAVAWAFGRRSR